MKQAYIFLKNETYRIKTVSSIQMILNILVHVMFSTGYYANNSHNMMILANYEKSFVNQNS